jgi:endo-1,4-beta-xylanase
MLQVMRGQDHLLKVAQIGTLPPIKEAGAARGLDIGFLLSKYMRPPSFEGRTGSVNHEPFLRRHAATSVVDWHLVQQPTQGVYSWADADWAVDFLETRGIKPILGGYFADSSSVRPWVEAITNPTALRGVLENTIQTVVSRYGTRVKSWCISNETFWPLNWGPPANGFQPGHWYNVLGTSFLEYAFKAADAAAHPSTELWMNVAWIEWDQAASVRPKILEAIDDLLSKGCRITGLGFQFHVRPGAQTTGNALADFMNQVAQRGLKIMLTEVDVIDLDLPAATRIQDAATLFTNMLTPVVRDVPALSDIHFWDIDDVNSWVGVNYARADGLPHRGGNLMGRDLGPSLLYHTFLQCLQSRPLV